LTDVYGSHYFLRLHVDLLSLSMSLLLPFLAFLSFLFFFNAPAPTEIYTLSLHDALPIWARFLRFAPSRDLASLCTRHCSTFATRSEEHTSELQSPYDLVCRLLLEKKKKKNKKMITNVN